MQIHLLISIKIKKVKICIPYSSVSTMVPWKPLSFCVPRMYSFQFQLLFSAARNDKTMTENASVLAGY